MQIQTLLPAPTLIRLDYLVASDVQITLVAHTYQGEAACPNCGRPATRVQNQYTRTSADLPWHGIPVQLQLRLRRLFCDQPRCPTEIFTVNSPAYYARLTSPGRGIEPPPMRPASEMEWCGERKGRVVTSAALAGSRPEMEWILVHSSASSKESGGRIVTIRFASIVFPEPGGPTSRMFATVCEVRVEVDGADSLAA
jgi:transposase